MLGGIIFSIVLGISGINLLMFFAFKSGYVYNYITKKGTVRDKFETGSKRWLALPSGMMLIYLVLTDMMVFGYNPYPFPVVMLLNISLVGVLLTYNTFVINHWLLVIVRPMVLRLSKMMTPVTIKSYSRFTWIYGGAGGFVIAMLSGWFFLLINYLAR